jgi:hypothetical protein
MGKRSAMSPDAETNLSRKIHEMNFTVAKSAPTRIFLKKNPGELLIDRVLRRDRNRSSTDQIVERCSDELSATAWFRRVQFCKD